MNRVIDMLSILPSATEMAQFVAQGLAVKGSGYLSLYGKRGSQLLELSEEELSRTVGQMTYNRLVEFLTERLRKVEMSLDTFMTQLDEWGVEKIVVFRVDEEEVSGISADNEGLARIVQRYPSKIIGFAGTNPRKGMQAVHELERCVKELGFKGLFLRPFGQEMYANDRRFYPLYAKAAELDIPIWMHTSINFSRSITMDYGRPIYLDMVASDFPELKLIIGHGGWPWVNEAMALCWKHPNIYIDISSTHPKYLATPDSGWGSLIRYGDSILQDKVLFASLWLQLGMSLKQVVDEVRKLPLKEEVKEKWLYKNAARLLGLNRE